MAKKGIISDFSALKGKVSFSEEAPSAGRVLNVGQEVVLMDSHLRGKIVSIGKTVGIELEDGLMIQAAYGEFAVTDDREILELKESKIKVKKSHDHARKAKGPSSSGLLTIDLHIEAIPGGRSIPKGQQLEFQMDTFRRTLCENLSHRGLKICFIHGIGDGILKAAIRKELDEVHTLRCSYSVGDPAVTVVSVK